MKTCCLQSRGEVAAATSVVILIAVLLSGCGAKLPPLKTVASVDIQRFMGDWYVIANIPTSIEKEAYNAVESYPARCRRHHRNDVHLPQRRF
jgi:apolipoprotein D and lipocalin family protein